MKTGIIGTGKIGIGPLVNHQLFIKNQKILINRATEKWKDAIQKGYIEVHNIASDEMFRIPVITEIEEFKKYKDNETLVFLYHDIKDRDIILKSLDLCLISVGKNIETVVNSLPKLEYPVIMAENDYDTLVRLMEKSENQLYPSVIDCHSSLFELEGNVLRLCYGSNMTLQILDQEYKIRDMFSHIPKEVTFCDKLRQLDFYHFTKFYGINLTHRILVYLLMEKQYKQNGKVITDDVTPFFDDILLTRYYDYANAIVRASYIEEYEKIQEFYGVDTFEEGYSIYTDTLMILAEVIAEKTQVSGDSFSRVINYGTQDYLIRLHQSKGVIETLLEYTKQEAKHPRIDEKTISSVMMNLEKIIELLNFLERK